MKMLYENKIYPNFLDRLYLKTFCPYIFRVMHIFIFFSIISNKTLHYFYQILVFRPIGQKPMAIGARSRGLATKTVCQWP